MALFGLFNSKKDYELYISKQFSYINYNATDKEGSQGYYRKRYVCCNGIYNS